MYNQVQACRNYCQMLDGIHVSERLDRLDGSALFVQREIDQIKQAINNVSVVGGTGMTNLATAVQGLHDGAASAHASLSNELRQFVQHAVTNDAELRSNIGSAFRDTLGCQQHLREVMPAEVANQLQQSSSTISQHIEACVAQSIDSRLQTLTAVITSGIAELGRRTSMTELQRRTDNLMQGAAASTSQQQQQPAQPIGRVPLLEAWNPPASSPSR